MYNLVPIFALPVFTARDGNSMLQGGNKQGAVQRFQAVAKQVMQVKVVMDALQSEPDVSETYNPQAKLLRISDT
jgi:hypothetical protein